MIGDDVIVEDLAELVVGYVGKRPIIGVGGRVADQNVDSAKMRRRDLGKMAQILLGGDIGGD